ncbi:hypothetical protein RFI_13223 [Reticulomyxa filosa]|uniref:Uncharacterized protein n=1 Tax=Reticulomyxa filosa TaxID=46433 RepID=X6NCB2_RETFI|nr:hypothetical protein RFI_13223 [Reticulomyxa filosa]|eukprot:ETO23935.1 hypothetical protein RFI_13223 [Reticulomyxa filosa]
MITPHDEQTAFLRVSNSTNQDSNNIESPTFDSRRDTEEQKQSVTEIDDSGLVCCQNYDSWVLTYSTTDDVDWFMRLSVLWYGLFECVPLLWGILFWTAGEVLFSIYLLIIAFDFWKVVIYLLDLLFHVIPTLYFATRGDEHARKLLCPFFFGMTTNVLNIAYAILELIFGSKESALLILLVLLPIGLMNSLSLIAIFQGKLRLYDQDFID